MVHPLIGNLKDLSDEEISDKLKMLYNKLSQAYSMNNRGLIDQVQLCVQSYISEHDLRVKRQMEEGAKASAQEQSGYDFDSLINIK